MQETLDLFELPDFDDDDEDEEYEPPVRKRRKGKAVPVIEDDEEIDEDNGNGDDEEADEDYEAEEGDDDDEEDEDDEEDDEEITLQKGRAEQRKKKSVTKSADVEVMEERRTGQRCANIEEALEYRKYIRDLVKEFETHVAKGKQVTRKTNIVTSDRSGKDAGQIAREILDNLPTAQKNDCKHRSILRRLIKHNMEAHESAMKAGKE